MKKIFAAVLASVMVVAMLAVAVGAQSQAMNGTGWDPSVVVNVKKANPDNVVKDGVINSNEYEKFEVDLTEFNSPLHVTFISGDDMQRGINMLATMEYYFSWDEVHGINIAIRNKPEVIQQLLDVKDGEKTEDDFCRNVAWGISASTDNDGVLYFALGKRTDDGRYLEGQYGPDQLGVNKNYNPTELQDYIITYDNATGYCTIEWSIPLSNFLAGGGGVGSELQFTLWANAGTSTVPDDFSGDSGAIYGVVLGDFGFMVNQKSMINNVKYLLTADELAGDPVPVPDPPVPGPTPTPTPTPVDPDNPNPAPNPDNSGNGGDNGSGSGNGNANNGGNGTAPRTGDPMIIMAAVAAVSAAGAFIVGKKRH